MITSSMRAENSPPERRGEEERQHSIGTGLMLMTTSLIGLIERLSMVFELLKYFETDRYLEITNDED